MLHDRLQRARRSLLGLSLGDALGSQFFIPGNRHHLSSRSLPPGRWQWTDDTEMACSIYLTLATHHTIDQDALAASFARRHDFDRGYGPATGRLLRLVREGGDWRALSATVTHSHPEAVAGAVAVAVAAAHVANGPLSPGRLVDRVLEHVPQGRVHDGIREARRMLTVTDPDRHHLRHRRRHHRRRPRRRAPARAMAASNRIAP
jgi:ADP-ribosylglycohydrolase